RFLSAAGAPAPMSTHVPSATLFRSGTSTAYGSSTSLDSGLVLAHSQALSGLAAATTYHYRVKSRDGAGNLATSGDFTFTTSAAPAATPPAVSRAAGGSLSASRAAVT